MSSRPSLSNRVRDYLRSPLEGYGGAVTPEWSAELRRAFTALVEDGDLRVAESVAVALEGRLGDFPPAAVLAAQVEFVEGGYERVVERLSVALASHPGYVAGHLLLGRAAELAGDPVSAYRSYREAQGDATADRRSAAVSEAAIQQLRIRLDDQLRRGRIEQARRAHGELALWAPGSVVTLEASRRIALETGDLIAELSALRGLVDLGPSRELERRHATLEVEVGDSSVGIDLFEGLVAQYPNDAELADGLAAAKFRWRLNMLPEDVVALVGPETLSRGDFATLLYWMLPGVRTSRSRVARIASDVPLEHPQREAIVRVVNLGLMPVRDATMHRFDPDRKIGRAEAFASLLGWLSADAQCASSLRLNDAPSREGVCQAAVRCQLVPEVADCLPGGELVGLDAREIVRRSLDLVKVQR